MYIYFQLRSDNGIFQAIAKSIYFGNAGTRCVQIYTRMQAAGAQYTHTHAQGSDYTNIIIYTKFSTFIIALTSINAIALERYYYYC